jgi:hypothetical protein
MLFASREMVDLLEQVLEPEEGTNALVQRMLEGHFLRHGTSSSGASG